MITEFNIKYYIITLIILYWLYSYNINNNNTNNSNSTKKELIDKNKIHGILKKLKHYKKYNKNEYYNGKKSLMKIIKIFNNEDKFIHKNYQYDNLKFTISQCLNHFNSILLNLPNNRLSDSIYYKEIKNEYNNLSVLCKELHNYLYEELYTFGMNSKKNMTHNSRPILNDIVETSNFYDEYNIY